MDLDRVAPELRRPLRRVPSLPVERRWFRRLQAIALGLLPGRSVAGVRLEKRDGAGLGVRVFLPDVRRSPAALLWIHGGGFVIGRASMDDRLCAGTARDLGIVVVSVEYRLAPEHPFPAAIDDCHAAWAWLQERAATLGIEPDRVAIGGESAGGGLAAALAQRVVDGTGPRPVAQWLFCPMLDDRTAARRDLDAIRHFVWPNRANRFGWQSYLGSEPGGETVPAYAVPARRADLSGLPPAWIGVGEIDLFCDENRAYAERLRAAGVAVALDVVPGCPHGFEAWAPATEISRDYVARARAWLEGSLRDGPAGGPAWGRVGGRSTPGPS